MLLRICRNFLLRFLAVMKDLFSSDNLPCVHGLGYIIKEMNIHETYFTFLSKIGSSSTEGIRMGR